MTERDTLPFEPAPLARGLSAYRSGRKNAQVDLFLDGNEGRMPPRATLRALEKESTDVLGRYPRTIELEEELAARHGLTRDQVLVTAGADDGLERACRALLSEGHEIVMPVPTFEMLPRYAHLAGCRIVEVPWSGGPYPTEDVLAAVTARTRAIAMVSPNNPTGAVATRADLERVTTACPHVPVLLDHAYAEFTDEDLTSVAVRLPQVLVFRTFSKAWGLAGLRVGYVMGHPEVIGWLCAVGHPYAVSGPSVAIALARLRQGPDAIAEYVERVRVERRELQELLVKHGVAAATSDANFVLGRLADPGALAHRLLERGIAVRVWPGRPHLADAVRITCPGDESDMTRLVQALEAALADGKS